MSHYATEVCKCPEKCKNMTKRKRLKLWKEYRTWPKWYYHVVLDSIETGQLFNDESEYVDGMNTVAIAQYIHNVSIVVFNFMINHGHFLVLATGNDIVNCMSFIFRRINARLIANGHSPLPENYGFKLIRVKDKKQLDYYINDLNDDEIRTYLLSKLGTFKKKIIKNKFIQGGINK